ncbi:MAG: HlyD family secretion protein [Hyphomicrobiaceae bacterium]
MLARLSWLERARARVPVARLPSLRLTLLVLVPAAVALVALVIYLLGGRYVSTDNAYVGAQKVLITPEVSGRVVRIAVTEGQLLKPGDELLAIDPEPYRFTAQEAEARLMRVRNDLATLKANVASLARQIELARQSLAAARADFDRKTKLMRDRISSQSELDKARVALTAAQTQLELLEQQARAARIQLLGDPDLPVERYPQFIEASVALDRAKRDLANTVLRAPIAGVATQVSSIQMGRYLTAGMAVFSVVSGDVLWIDANPKETDLTYVRPGQPVAIAVDAFPDRRLEGTVMAISPGTGAQFAILPPQNAAGNWIKVVQRVPIRVKFAPGQDLRRLRAGMSATVEIDTGRRGRLARFLNGSAAAEQDREP